MRFECKKCGMRYDARQGHTCQPRKPASPIRTQRYLTAHSRHQRVERIAKRDGVLLTSTSTRRIIAIICATIDAADRPAMEASADASASSHA